MFQQSWDDLVSAANRAEAKARIHGSHHLDQQCPRGKRPLKMCLNPHEQPAQPKASAPQTRAHSPPADQSEASGRAQRERKRTLRGKGHREASPATSQDVSEPNDSRTDASGTNATQAEEAQKEAPKRKRQNGPNKRDVHEVTCYNCNKKGHYAKHCTEPKD